MILKAVLSAKFPQSVFPAVYGKEYFKFMSDSKLVFNTYATSEGCTIDNMKMFEAPVVGNGPVNRFRTKSERLV